MLHHTTTTDSNEMLLRSLLSDGGPGTSSAPPVAPIATFAGDDNALRSLIELATAHRVIGPTVWALHDAGIELSDEVAALVKERFQGAMLWCLELEVRLLEIKRWFDDAGGIEFLVLKGASVAHLDELDTSQRSFADLDLLIRARDMDRALEVLQAHGAVRRIPEHHRGFDRRFVKGVGLTCGDGIEVDVHRTLCVGALGFRIPLEELFARPDNFVLGGESFAALRIEHRALHAAYHAVVGSPEPALHTLRDLSRYLTQPSLSPEALVPEARRWRGETVLWSAVQATEAAFRPLPSAWLRWAEGFTPDQRDVDILATSRATAHFPIDLARLRELSVRDRFGYCWGVATPSSAVLAQRDLTRPQWILRGAKGLVRKL